MQGQQGFKLPKVWEAHDPFKDLKIAAQARGPPKAFRWAGRCPELRGRWRQLPPEVLPAGQSSRGGESPVGESSHPETHNWVRILVLLSL